MVTPDARRALVRRIARSILTRARVVGLRRMAERTAAAFARGNGSEAELAGSLVGEDALERSRTLDLPALPRRGDSN
jgi:hypothetical protein